MSMGMTPEQIHNYQHKLVRDRIIALLDSELTGRKLAIARDLLAFTLLGHSRLYPDCRCQPINHPTSKGPKDHD